MQKHLHVAGVNSSFWSEPCATTSASPNASPGVSHRPRHPPGNPIPEPVIAPCRPQSAITAAPDQGQYVQSPRATLLPSLQKARRVCVQASVDLVGASVPETASKQTNDSSNIDILGRSVRSLQAAQVLDVKLQLGPGICWRKDPRRFCAVFPSHTFFCYCAFTALPTVQ